MREGWSRGSPGAIGDFGNPGNVTRYSSPNQTRPFDIGESANRQIVHCFIVSLFHCSIVPLFIVPLFHCSLFQCILSIAEGLRTPPRVFRLPAPFVVGEVGRRALCSDPAEGAFVCARAVVGYNRGAPPMATPTRYASTHREVMLAGLHEGVTR